MELGCIQECFFTTRGNNDRGKIFVGAIKTNVRYTRTTEASGVNIGHLNKINTHKVRAN